MGDYEVFYRCAGAGSPTVVVEDGTGLAGASDHTWDAVVSEVQQVTRICVYDRPPLGLSQGNVPVRAANAVAQDLHKLLANARIGGPYVLVGYSLGGLFVRSYAAQYPHDVVGMVLVDAVSADYYSRARAVLPAVTGNEPEALTSFRRSLASFWGSSRGTNADRVNIAGSLQQAARLTSLGDLPLVALSHGGSSELFSAGLPGDLGARLEQMWLETVTEQARLSTNGRLVVASQPDHAIHQAEPQLVIDAILNVLEQARKR